MSVNVERRCVYCERVTTGTKPEPHAPECPAPKMDYGRPDRERVAEQIASRFCMAAFIGSMSIEVQSFRNWMLTRSAALRFEASPCPCDGCRAYSADLAQRGQSSIPTSTVEVKP